MTRTKVPDRFVALDFELANADPRSICALGASAVEKGKCVWEMRQLFRPSPRRLQYTPIHGIDEDRLAGAASFAELWPSLLDCLRRYETWVAHNAAFERRVLRACAVNWGLERPSVRWICTMALCESLLGRGYRALDVACHYLDLPLDHHSPLSDARAAAQLLLRLGNPIA